MLVSKSTIFKRLNKYNNAKYADTLDDEFKTKVESSEDQLLLYRGINSGNKFGHYWSTSQDWARQFTQSGQDHEIKRGKLHKKHIYVAKPLPKATKEKEMDIAINHAKKHGFKAVQVDEGSGEPNSVFVLNKNEKLESQHTRPFDVTAGVKTYKNPSLEAFKALVKNAAYNELRGLLNQKGDVYWWPSSRGDHQLVQEEQDDDKSLRLYFHPDTMSTEQNPKYILAMLDIGTIASVSVNFAQLMLNNKSFVDVLTHLPVMVDDGSDGALPFPAFKSQFKATDLQSITAVTVDTAFEILKARFAEAFSKDFSLPAAQCRQAVRSGKYPKIPEAKPLNQTRDERNAILQEAYQGKPGFDEVWSYISSTLGSEKYTFNVMQWYVGTNKKPKSMRYLEDAGRAASALKLKERFAQQIKREPELKKYQDLNQITFTDLEDLADLLKARTTANQDKAGYEESLIKSKQARILYNDDEWKVVTFSTEEASKYYGRGTRWCTAADKNNYFDSYNNDGPLYVFIHKKDNRKWQLHFETGSLMDAKDEEVDAFEYNNGEDNDSYEYRKINPDVLLLGPIFNKVFNVLKMPWKEFGSAYLRAYLTFPYVNDQTKIALVEKYGIIGAETVNNPSPEFINACLQKDGYFIRYVKNPTSEQQMMAVRERNIAINYIKWPSEEVQLLVLSKNIMAFDQLERYASEKVLLYVAEHNPSAIFQDAYVVTQVVADKALETYKKKYEENNEIAKQSNSSRLDFYDIYEQDLQRKIVPKDQLPYEQHLRGIDPYKDS